MKPPIIIIGIGELASVFARAFLRSGYPVYPVTRDMSMAQEAEDLPEPQMVLVAVAETDFTEVMLTIPAPWRDRLVLMQNELLPRDWQAHGLEAPTVISVWFEKKRGMDYNPLIPSPVYGPGADLLARALAELEIPCRVLSTAEELVFELVLKNVFVYTINIAGLVLDEGTTTSMLWQQHEQLTRDVAADIMVLQEAVAGKSFSRDALMEGLVKGINGDPHHKCRGRAAPDRLARAIDAADQAGIQIPAIKDINQRL